MPNLTKKLLLTGFLGASILSHNLYAPVNWEQAKVLCKKLERFQGVVDLGIDQNQALEIFNSGHDSRDGEVHQLRSQLAKQEGKVGMFENVLYEAGITKQPTKKDWSNALKGKMTDAASQATAQQWNSLEDECKRQGLFAQPTDRVLGQDALRTLVQGVQASREQAVQNAKARGKFEVHTKNLKGLWPWVTQSSRFAEDQFCETIVHMLSIGTENVTDNVTNKKTLVLALLNCGVYFGVFTAETSTGEEWKKWFNRGKASEDSDFDPTVLLVQAFDFMIHKKQSDYAYQSKLEKCLESACERWRQGVAKAEKKAEAQVNQEKAENAAQAEERPGTSVDAGDISPPIPENPDQKKVEKDNASIAGSSASEGSEIPGLGIVSSWSDLVKAKFLEKGLESKNVKDALGNLSLEAQMNIKNNLLKLQGNLESQKQQGKGADTQSLKSTLTTKGGGLRHTFSFRRRK